MLPLRPLICAHNTQEIAVRRFLPEAIAAHGLALDAVEPIFQPIIAGFLVGCHANVGGQTFMVRRFVYRDATAVDLALACKEIASTLAEQVKAKR